ncbi:MAG: protease inhibitor I9 family protein, partial [Nanoarchaeota archaeon]|nr:protease inhibitor I9 family protein [Nanoarchaeota archaeon]
MARNKIIGSILSILVILIIISLISGVIASDKTSNKIVNKIVDKKYDTITAYGLDIPELGQKAGVTVSSQIKEKLQTDKKVRAIVTMKEPKAVKGWSKKVAAMKTSQVKELKKAARESAINNIGRQRVKHTYNSFNGFSASLTQEEFNDLIASGMVESIEYDEPFYISLQDSTGIINATESWSLQYDGVNLTGAGQTVCVIDTGVDYTHPDLGGCTIENVTLVGNIINYSEESEHPYEDNTTVTYKINYTGFDSIAVHFVSINMELDWDFIYILDGNNNTVKNYTGHPSDIWSPHVAGDTIYIRLVADNYYNDSGFYIDKII